MSEDLTLNEIEARNTVDDEGTRRDQYGRYLIEGEPHTRVSTILDELDNKAALGPWHAAMAIGGLIADIEMMAEAREVWAQHDGNPWYSSPAGKQAAKALVERAAKRGGSKKAADDGHNVHALSAIADAGGTPQCPSAHHELWLEGYVNGLIRAGITIDPAHIEQIVVLDEITAAGMFDRGRCHVPGFDQALLGDLKSGGTLEWSQHTIPMQVGAYTHADAIVVQGAAVDGSEDRRLPMPDVSRDRALIIHAPFERPGEVNLHIVDAAAGWEAFKIAAAARRWHQGPGGAWEPLPGELVRQLQASIDAVRPPVDNELRGWLQQRVDIIGRHAKARARLQIVWPKNVPPLRASNGHTVEQLGAIEAVLDRIEADFSLPFGPSRPGGPEVEAQWLDRLLDAFPNSTVQGEQDP